MWRWIALVAALSAQLLGLYLPGSPQPSRTLIPHLDKLVHFAMFLAPAIAMRLLTRAWWPVVLLGLHAPISEFIQLRWVAFRSGDVWDVLADLLGVAVGAGLAHRRIS